MANFMQKLCLILWKNWIIRRYHYVVTLMELIVPIILLLLYSYLSSLGNVQLGKIQPNIFRPENISDKFPFDANIDGMKILFTPNTGVARKLMAEVASDLSTCEKCSFQSVKSEAEMESTYKSLVENQTRSYLVGVVFEKISVDGSHGQLTYKIRVPHLDTTEMYVSSAFDPNTADRYFYKGFASIQWSLDKSYIKLMQKDDVKISLMVEKFPLPALPRDNSKDLAGKIVTALAALSFIFLCPSILKRLVEEKTSGVRELMKLMGLKTWMCWLGWLLNALIPALVSITLIVIFLKISFKQGAPPVFDSCGGVLWCLFILYFLASVFLLFAVSAIFQKPALAMMIGLVLWIVSLIFGYLLSKKWSLLMKMLVLMLPNVALNYGISIITHYEMNGIAFQFSNLGGHGTAGVNTDLAMWHVWFMLFVDIWIFYLFTLYWESVFPGEYGIAKPWYYPFLLSSWKSVKVSVEEDLENHDTSNMKNYEHCTMLEPGIRIKNLRKEFSSLFGSGTKIAVDGITLDIYQNQITALLGHNGAGKSTTMLILTGMFSPSSGTVYIDGYDIRRNMSKVRESLGLCPQQNMLFTDLTVKQHLIFFAMLKGSSMREAVAESNELLRKLNLQEHKSKRPDELSGGMKRRLCLGVALCGDPKVVILDEPTSGLDPEARRQIWDLLLGMRGKRTIIITTHIMEEADVLGDRIAIMDHGRIQCYGTSMFLKKLYGTGYQLQITKANGGVNGIKLTAAVESVVPQATIKSSLPSLVTYDLPATETDKFPALFSVLEKNKKDLGIQGIGVSITTLEEVFLKVGELSEEKLNTSEHSPQLNPAKGEGRAEDTNTLSEESLSLNSSDDLKLTFNFVRKSGLGLLVQQIEALFLKRCLYLYRTWLFTLIQALLQVLLVGAITYASIRQSAEETSDPLKLTLDVYGPTKVFYSTDGHSSLPHLYEDIIKSAQGIPQVVDDVETALLDRGTENLMDYQRKYIAAAQFNISQRTINALYSDFAVHSVPISVNLISNTLLKNATTKESSITVTSYPFKNDETEALEGMFIPFLWRIIPVLHIFWMGIFMILPMKERVSECKQVQLMTGVNSVTYWFTHYAWDGMLNLLVSTFMILAVVCVDTEGIFSGGRELGVLLIILMAYGMSGIPFSYFISFMKNTISGCYGFLVMFIVLINIIFGIVILLLTYFNYKWLTETIGYLYYLVPMFAFSEAVAQYATIVYQNNECKLIPETRLRQMCANHFGMEAHRCCSCMDSECDKPYNYIETSGSNAKLFHLLLYMSLSSILYFAIIFLRDFGIIEWLLEKLSNIKAKEAEPVRDLDSDVYSEETRIQEVFKMENRRHDSSDALLVKDLVKRYNYNVIAVKGVSFGVLSGECFGLLGVNGAGKTTTFKMLTGGVIPTRGDAAIGEYSLKSRKSKYLAEIGYCPQYDPLIDCFTGWELLKFFGRLRGVPSNRLSSEVRKWINLLDLTEYQHRQCGTYSGGNKRKLSTAMALIGNPPVVFLDEPTSGVDPMSRRKLWSALLRIQKAGQSIVLTSHSMEECEALCNRLAIMVEGKLQCLGNIQHLKQKFGQGFTVKLKLDLEKTDSEKIQQLKTEMLSLFQSSCVLKDEHHSLLHYHVTDPNVSWSQLFTTMEDLKRQKDIIEDYTISETTLEQVFLSFAKYSQ
ncbi:phospholipid-transporting ATPase ABCA3 [Anabrus simplex]|uniref:phospholipid-transporting ATPase ABCA3 n=1 Tax=Anabrus simplex TaxID=316456 RepID=UPI0035A2C59B